MMVTLRSSLQATFIVALTTTIICYVCKLNPIYIQGSYSASTTDPMKYIIRPEEMDEDIREFNNCQKNSGYVPNLILQYGRPRTATTLQFHIVCVMVAMLHENELNNVSCFFMNGKYLKYNVIKTHSLSPFIDKLPPFSWIFMTSKRETSLKEKLKSINITKLITEKNLFVPYIANANLVSKRGHFIVYEYQRIFGFSDSKMEQIVEYFRYWDILRLCCGKQMSADWRYKLAPIEGNKLHHEIHGPTYPACEMYNISAVELGMINTYVFKKLSQAKSLRHFIGKPALSDAVLDGTYCSRCNENIVKKSLKFNQKCD